MGVSATVPIVQTFSACEARSYPHMRIIRIVVFIHPLKELFDFSRRYSTWLPPDEYHWPQSGAQVFSVLNVGHEEFWTTQQQCIFAFIAIPSGHHFLIRVTRCPGRVHR